MHDSRRTRLVLGGLIVAALVLITASYQDGGSPILNGLRSASSAVFGGAESATNSATSLVSGSSSGGSGSGVQALRREVVQLRGQLSQEQLSQTDYAQLRRLLSLSGKGGYRIVAANVIATGQGYQQTVTLDAGSSDGVRPRETVLNGQGLVGEVITVSADTCTVLLATDSSAQVGIELAPSGEVGWVTGPGKTPSGTGRLRLQILDAGAVLTPGEQLVTSASVKDRPYVPGVPVGVISAVENRAGALTARAQVRPYVNFTALGVVGIVIVPPRHSPRFSVLPPRPHARPTPTVTVTVTPGATASPVLGTSPGSTGPGSTSPGSTSPTAPPTTPPTAGG
jgi:rod shape-determining protein MreC